MSARSRVRLTLCTAVLATLAAACGSGGASRVSTRAPSQSSEPDGSTKAALTTVAPPPPAPADTGHAPSLQFLTPTEGWQVEQPGSSHSLEQTKDGGSTWTTSFTAPDEIRSFAFASPEIGYAVTDSEIVATQDGGTKWTPVGAPKDALFVVIDSNTNPWVLTTDNTLFSSSDGGQTWTAVESPPLQSLCATSAPSLVGAGTDGVYVSADSGKSWQHAVTLDRPAAGPNQVTCTGQSAFAAFDFDPGMRQVDRATYLTTDGGTKWTLFSGGTTIASATDQAALGTPAAIVGSASILFINDCFSGGAPENALTVTSGTTDAISSAKPTTVMSSGTDTFCTLGATSPDGTTIFIAAQDTAPSGSSTIDLSRSTDSGATWRQAWTNPVG